MQLTFSELGDDSKNNALEQLVWQQNIVLIGEGQTGGQLEAAA